MMGLTGLEIFIESAESANPVALAGVFQQ